MKSKWLVRVQTIAGTDFYQVHRFTDVSGVRDDAHVETRGGLYSTEAEAVKVAAGLNNEEAKA